MGKKLTNFQLVSFLVLCHAGFTLNTPLIHKNPQILVCVTVTQSVCVTLATVSGPTDFLSTHLDIRVTIFHRYAHEESEGWALNLQFYIIKTRYLLPM